MSQKKLSEKIVKELLAPDPTGTQKLHWDTETKGFGVLCSGTSTIKTYIAKGNLRGRSVRKTIERVDLISLKDARDRAKQMLVNFSAGIDPRELKLSSPTLQQALDLYLTLRTDLRPSSREDYRGLVERHLSGWLNLPLRSITREMVERRLREIAKEVEQHHRSSAAAHAERHLARAERTAASWPEASERHRVKHAAASERTPYTGFATANRAMRALRAIWNFVAERNDGVPAAALPPNPVKLKRQWFPVKRRKRLVKADDLPAFYAALTQLENTVMRDYILLMLFTGLRRREAASLEWSDVDLQGRVIRVDAEETKTGEKLDLPMSDIILDMMIARRSICSDNWVFPANSKSGHVESPKFAFEKIKEATGLRYSPHDLRRTFVTTAESCEISTFALKAMVNHSLGSGDITGGYVEMTAQRLRGPAQLVADLIKERCGVKAIEGNVARLR
jgi:integrase